MPGTVLTLGSTVAERRGAKVASILEAARRRARGQGIGGVRLRAPAREVGMRQPSLDECSDSKHDLDDAMFADLPLRSRRLRRLAIAAVTRRRR
jgi:hypothetical protein